MYTQCPSCQAVFRVADTDDDAPVACPACTTVFVPEKVPLLEAAGRTLANGVVSRQPPPVAENLETHKQDTPHITVPEITVPDIEARTVHVELPPVTVDKIELEISSTTAPAAPEASDATAPHRSDARGQAPEEEDATTADLASESAATTESVVASTQVEVTAPAPASDDAKATSQSTATRPTSSPRLDAEQLYPELALHGETASSRSKGTWAWALLVVVMLAVFTAQSLIYLRADLSHTALRPWIARACGYLGCTTELPRAPELIRIIDRGVQSHPNVAGALRVHAQISNTGAYAQAYPIVRLAFFDLRQQSVGQREFRPEEYLSAGIDPQTGLDPNTPTNVTLEIVDPGSRAVSFLIDFL